MAGGQAKSICAGWRTLTPHKGNDRITQCDSGYRVRHPRGSYIVCPLMSLEVATPEKTNQAIRAVILMQARPPQKRFLVHTKDAAHPSCITPNTLRRFALGARNVCP